MTLVVLLGPIASGKSTIASALVDRLPSCEAIDLDDIYFLEPERGWEVARVKHAAAVASSRADVVIAHGPLVVEELQPDLVVLLMTTYDTALERVTADESRLFSRDPVFLRRTYDEFVEQPHDLCIETTSISEEETVARVLALLEART